MILGEAHGWGLRPVEGAWDWVGEIPDSLDGCESSAEAHEALLETCCCHVHCDGVYYWMKQYNGPALDPGRDLNALFAVICITVWMCRKSKLSQPLLAACQIRYPLPKVHTDELSINCAL